MRKQIFQSVLTLILVVCVVGTAQAKSWRINNISSLKPHFADINAAMNSSEVQEGDTLYLDPGCTYGAFEGQTISKKVTVVGTGYFLYNFPYNEASIQSLTISATGVKIMGLVVSNISIKASNITIERCKIGVISGNSDNIIIRSCYIDEDNATDRISSSGKNWQIDNNIIRYNIQNYGYCINGLKNSIIRNNYIYHRGYGSNYKALNSCTGCEIINNIITSISDNCTNCVINNNVFTCSVISKYPNNKYGATNIISSWNNDIYTLTENSPAKGYATDGGDCGPYGSGYTYVPSGLPFGHPYYTQINVGSPAKEGKLNVTYKVKIQDE